MPDSPGPPQAGAVELLRAPLLRGPPWGGVGEESGSCGPSPPRGTAQAQGEPGRQGVTCTRDITTPGTALPLPTCVLHSSHESFPGAAWKVKEGQWWITHHHKRSRSCFPTRSAQPSRWAPGGLHGSSYPSLASLTGQQGLPLSWSGKLRTVLIRKKR